jgi:hypothetical protein
MNLTMILNIPRLLVLSTTDIARGLACNAVRISGVVSLGFWMYVYNSDPWVPEL